MDRFFEKFILYLKFELRFSDNTIKSYSYDLDNYFTFIKNKNIDIIFIRDSDNLTQCNVCRQILYWDDTKKSS